MKKIFFSFLAIAALASCAKTEPTFTEVDSEIKIAPVTAMSTKAQTGVIDGTAYNQYEMFDVYAYWKDVPAGDKFNTGATTYLAGTNSGVVFKKDGDYWGGDTPYYWPKNGSLRFAAYSPSDINMTHNLEQDTYVLDNFTYETSTAETFDILVAPTSESYTAETAKDKVSVVFEHALSWVSFEVKSTVKAKDMFVVTDVVANDIVYKGTLTAKMSGTDAAKTWTLDESVSSDVTIYGAASKTVTETAANVETNPNGFMVLPQVPTEVTVTFNQEGINGAPDINGQTVTVPLSLDAIGTPWEPGKHYTYTIVFDVDEIFINPEVVDWTDVPSVEVSTDPVKVTTAAQLVDAIAAGKDVTLDANITLDEPIIVEPVATRTDAASVEVEVNLNGKNIDAPLFAESDGTVDPSGNSDSYAFWVKEGGKLTINGNGNVKTQACKYSIAVWAQGGEVVINGGNYENAGEGSDLIYASAGGKVTINGGTFKANEKQANVDGTAEKRSALNLKDADKATSSIVVYGGSFYLFDPANNKSENPAVSFVATGYNVVKVGDWYTVSAPAAAVALTGDATVNATYQIENGVLDGAEKTFSLTAGTEKFFIGNTLRLINTKGNATIKNVTIDGNNASYDVDGNAETTKDNYGIRAIFATGAGVVNIDNVTIKNVTYTFNDDSAAKTVNVTDSEFQGWTSFNANTEFNFTRVKFTMESADDATILRPYGNAVLTNCSFVEEFPIDLGSLAADRSVVFENCTYGGKPLTADNLQNAEGKAFVIR